MTRKKYTNDPSWDYKVWEYKNYDEYVSAQNAGYNRKVNTHVGVGIECIERLKEEILDIRPDFKASNIICHGTRSGHEQQCFIKTFNPEYCIGTEIADGCEKWPNTFKWDMQKPIDEFFDKFDILYSNAFDHAMEPEKCLNTWANQVRIGGCLVLEAYVGSSHTSTDPNAYSTGWLISELESNGCQLIKEWAKPNFAPPLLEHFKRKPNPYKCGVPTFLFERKR